MHPLPSPSFRGRLTTSSRPSCLRQLRFSSLLLLFTLGTSALTANTITVTNTNDAGAGSLRQAVLDANPLDTIRFDAALTATVSATVTLQTQITIDKALTIIGTINGNHQVIIDGANSTRIFHINLSNQTERNVTLDSLTLSHGQVASSQRGGAIWFQQGDTLNLRHSHINGCSAGFGGAIAAHNFSTATPSAVLLDHSTLRANYAVVSGGAVWALGGGFLLHTSHCTVDSNSSNQDGGAYYLLSSDTGAVAFNVDSSTFHANDASRDGGATFANLMGRNYFSLFQEVTFSHNTCARDGGAQAFSTDSVYQHEALRCTYNGNIAGEDGGAICMKTGNSSTARWLTNLTNQSTLVNNHAGDDGGAIYGHVINGASYIWSERSTILNNTAGDTAASFYTRCSFSWISSFVPLYLGNSVVWSNDSNNLYNADIETTVVSGGYNVLSDDPDRDGLDNNTYLAAASLLPFGPLQNNGGFTETLLPLAGSILLNAGNPNDSAQAQNGPLLGVRDIGAAETQLCEHNVFQVVETCGQYFWAANATTYTSSGTYQTTLSNASNCDSALTLDLTLNAGAFTSVSETACDEFTWPANLQVYTESTIDTTVYIAANGCDSLIELNLTILESEDTTEVVEQCEPYTWPVNNVTYSETGTYLWTGINAAGCDSTRILELEVNAPNTTITKNGVALFVPVMDSVIWYDCDNGALIPVHSFSYMPIVAGNYAAISTKGACTDTSECVYVNPVGIQGVSEDAVRLYPNPASDEFFLKWQGETAHVKVYDAVGRTVFEQQLSGSESSISVREWPAGMYVVHILIDEQSLVTHLAVER